MDKRGNEKIKKLSVGLILIVLLMFLVEIGSNFFYFRLSEGEKGVRKIADGSIDTTGFIQSAEGYRLDGNGGTLRIELGGKYVEKFMYSFDYDGLLDMMVTIQYHSEFGKAEQKTILDKNSAVIRQSVINIGKNVDWIELYTDTSLLLEDGVSYIDLSALPLNITDLFVKNTFQWNTIRMLCVFLFGVTILLLVIYRAFFGKQIAFSFLLISMTGGVLILTCFPVTKVGWDEETHFRRAYELSLYPGGEEVSPEFAKLFNCGIETWPLNLPASIEEKKEINAFFDENCTGGEGAVVQSSGIDTYTTGYIVPALFLKIGRFLNMPFSLLYQFGRLGGLLLYSLIMALAIKILPVGKRLLTMVGLMPTPMFLACCYSYDAVVIAFVSLGLSILLREALAKEGTFSWTNYFVAMACLVWGILPKAVYAPLVLTGLLIPASKFKDNRQKWLMRAGILFFFLALMSTFVLPSLLSPSSYGDSRGGDVSVALQMKNILTQPLSYIKVLTRNVWRSLPSYLIGGGAFQILGHWGIAGFGSVTMIFSCFAVLTDSSGNEEEVLSRKNKIVLFVISLMTVVLIWTAFYLTYTVPGSSTIEGVQGRYFLPVLLPLFLVAGVRRLQIRCSDSARNMIVTGFSAFLLFTMIWTQLLMIRNM
ncbi:DUF2142 domain-containing protein [Qiania dongpingensis]|uniref:DUF2142 domain-containing protein n=1 Tax=Qiania dongpingensis TaxID=2763669 RepID=A0A7G9G7U2_9FIRM|nr:DUF2142 domain-containing protein [Qiania dongpingensis]QNM06874.1 DUF2142 domain-containing protein [Qiania dongpingensis]